MANGYFCGGCEGPTGIPGGTSRNWIEFAVTLPSLFALPVTITVFPVCKSAETAPVDFCIIVDDV